MELIQQVPELSAYLAVDEAIDHEHPLVRDTVADLRSNSIDAYTYAAAAYAFVRDAIPHSADSGDMRVAWRASDVLATRNGICHSKSHALAALLRAAGIPTALCYQGLGDENGGPGPVHGLIAVRLPGRDRWDRQDPRGNKPGVDAHFSLDEERLAWPVRPEFNEVDYPVLYAAPHPAVLRGLRSAGDRPELWRTLPTAL
ncbi:transglutaminase domain-containing protein [Streptomyces sp. Ncost-T10-10d]|uniref:transglutaminase domain-containing protein n=1 Tax=Streptomyces sp. Ncost-T10-10d TaxID=1839774 RepID=UPI00081F5F8B|nr:transglutaminase domain-containing protein [Streptomyces sp. Ncost-T10-10d]SCF62232.1 Transglutaminase-like superfamily protein [Streptomyces sp. Ncost-T10-10d]